MAVEGCPSRRLKTALLDSTASTHLEHARTWQITDSREKIPSQVMSRLPATRKWRGKVGSMCAEDCDSQRSHQHAFQHLPLTPSKRGPDFSATQSRLSPRLQPTRGR